MSFSSEQQSTDIHTPLPELNIQDLEQMNDEEFWNYARQRARMVSDPPSRADYLACELSNGSFLIPLNDLAEVLPPPYRLALLPGMPTWMVGIMAWRGETIAVVDLDLFFASSQDAVLPRTTDGMLLVVYAPGQALGLLISAPGLTTTIELEQVAPLATSTHALLIQHAELFKGVHVDIPILNISALLASLVQQIGMATTHG